MLMDKAAARNPAALASRLPVDRGMGENMESERFDELIRGAFAGATRRGVVRVGAGALAASAVATLGRGPSEVDAKKKKKKRKKKKRCSGNRPVKCGNGCCPSNFSQCCENASEPVNPFTCNPSDFTCCSLEDGGGSCPSFASQCCPPTILDPFGTCALETDVCCTSVQGGGFCEADFPVCCPFDPEDPSFGSYCCGEGETCCLIDEDCEGSDVCDEFGCCVPEVLLTSGAAERRGKHREARSTERFYKKAK
jgi:hypothetical protein